MNQTPIVVVLDDDPTGTQSVHGVRVITTWQTADLEREFGNSQNAVFVLTNTRAMPPEQARQVNLEIGQNLKAASETTKRQFVIVSRSDSTLRGHFPLEIEALEAGLDTQFDAWLICPFFEAGGRVTIDNVHYLRQADQLIPVGQTEFAKDTTFGYRASDLREWVEEKTQGRIPVTQVASVSLETIRHGGSEQIAQQLMALKSHSVCIINAEHTSDLEKFILGLNIAEAQGKRFLYRTAASFAAARAGVQPRAMLTAEELLLIPNRGGLIVVGSYVDKSSQQLQHLLELPNLEAIEIHVTDLLEISSRQTAIAQAAARAEQAIQNQRDAVIYTSRERIKAGDLNIGERISSGLCEVVHSIATQPRFVLAKGGITSSDTATVALEVRSAEVLGQIAPGVPVWQLGTESRHPDLTYVVFPGNVGNPNTLADVVTTLRLPFVNAKQSP
jgi:uncharacterized protein YgbK (DUF1537 family)